MISTITYLTIIERLFTELNLLLRNTVFNGYTALVSYLRKPLGLAVVLYISLMGLAISQGWLKLSMGNLVRSTLKIGFIYMAAMNWSWFSHYVVDFINKGAGQIGSVLISATPVPIPRFSGEGINGAMQTVLIEFTEIGNWIWNKGAWNHPAPCFTALLIWGFGYMLILVAVFELVLAKIMLAILFSTAPLFVSFTLFKVTHGIFDRWLGACIGFALLMIFISSMLALALSIAQWAIAGTYISRAIDISLVGFIPIMIVGFIGTGILLKASHLAQSIGGTITIASGSTLLAGTIGGILGGTTYATFKMLIPMLRGAKELLNPSRRGKGGSGSVSMSAIRKGLIKPANKNE